MSKYIQRGKDLTNGVLKELAAWAFAGYLILFALAILADAFGLGVDSTDENQWHRSGMTIYTDHFTGVQYLRIGDAMHLCVDINGHPITDNQ